MLFALRGELPDAVTVQRRIAPIRANNVGQDDTSNATPVPFQNSFELFAAPSV
jgi:hypothetical protein